MDCAAMACITQGAQVDCLFPRGVHPSHRTCPHSQRSHNMHLVPFKGRQDTQCTPGKQNGWRRSMTHFFAGVGAVVAAAYKKKYLKI